LTHAPARAARRIDSPRARLALAVASLSCMASPLAPLSWIAGCAPPADVTPPIRVVPGAAARALWIGARGGPGAPAPPPPVAIARADGADVVLENEEVAFRFVRGRLVAAVDARRHADALAYLAPAIDGLEIAVDDAKPAAAAGGAATVVTTGRDARDPPTTVSARYTLHAGDRALLVEIDAARPAAPPSPEARPAAPPSPEALALIAAFDDARIVAPAPRDAGGAARAPFVGAIARRVSYALTTTEGDVGAAVSGRTIRVGEAALAPGDHARQAYVLVVGERGDSSSIVAELAKAAGEAVGAIAVDVVDARGQPVAPGDADRVALLGPSGDEVLAIAEDRGAFAGEAPAGAYDLAYVRAGARDAARAHIVVAAGARVRARLVVVDR